MRICSLVTHKYHPAKSIPTAPHHAAPAMAVPTRQATDIRETSVPEASVTELFGQGRRFQPVADAYDRCDFHKPIPSKA